MEIKCDYPGRRLYSESYPVENLTRIPKLNLGTRASRPQLIEKCGQDARVPGKGSALFRPSRLFVTNSCLTSYGRNIVSTSESGMKYPGYKVEIQVVL